MSKRQLWALLAATLCMLGMALYGAGCGGPLVVGPRVVQSLAEVADVAKDGIADVNKAKLDQYDAEAEKSGNTTAARAKIADWSGTVQKMREAFSVYITTVTGLKIAMVLAVAKKDISMATKIIGEATQAYAALRDTFAAFGVTLPGGL